MRRGNVAGPVDAGRCTTAHDWGRVVLRVEPRDGEGRAGRRGEDGAVVAGPDALHQLLEERVVEQVVAVSAAVDGVVVDQLGLHAELVEEGAQTVGSTVRTRVEDEHAVRMASRGVVASVGLIEGGGEVAGARGRLGAIDCHCALDVVQRRGQS